MKTILIVDDQPDFAELLAYLLRGEDNEIDTAYSVREAKQKMGSKKIWVCYYRLEYGQMALVWIS